MNVKWVDLFWGCIAGAITISVIAVLLTPNSGPIEIINNQKSPAPQKISTQH